VNDIVKWLSQVEETVAEIYRRAAGVFAEDPTFTRFLTTLAEQELQHSQIIKAAFPGRSLLKEEEIATTIDDETQRIVVTSLDGVMQRVVAGGLSRKEMVAMIADIEFFEWNGIFLYAMNVLKGNSLEYHSAREEIETHLKGIETFLSGLPAGEQCPEILRRLPSLDRLRVLVVEDDPALAALIKNILIRDAEVEVASNGKEGLERLGQGSFDVIVADVEMPVMNGIDMYKEAVRREISLKERFVFLTASQKPEYRSFLAEQRLPVLRKPSPINRIRQAVIGVSRRQRING
jgi:CheY-like chemotaxis protein